MMGFFSATFFLAKTRVQLNLFFLLNFFNMLSFYLKYTYKCAKNQNAGNVDIMCDNTNIIKQCTFLSCNCVMHVLIKRSNKLQFYFSHGPIKALSGTSVTCFTC